MTRECVRLNFVVVVRRDVQKTSTEERKSQIRLIVSLKQPSLKHAGSELVPADAHAFQ